MLAGLVFADVNNPHLVLYKCLSLSCFAGILRVSIVGFQGLCLVSLTSKSILYNFLSDYRSDTFKLNKNCFLRPSQGGYTLTDVTQQTTIVLYSDLFYSILHFLSSSISFEDLLSQLPLSVHCYLSSFLNLLCISGFLINSSQCQSFDHSFQSSSLWSFEDLLFHHRSRWDDFPSISGATFRGPKRSPIPSIVSMFDSDYVVSLCQPTAELSQPGFYDVLLNRKSKRISYSSKLSLSKLSKLLWFVFHIKNTYSACVDSISYDISYRPVPSAGGLHEIDLFIIVNNFPELESGSYFYNPSEHQLEFVQSWNCFADQLLMQAAMAANLDSAPSFLLCLSCRYDRLAWKYEGFVYSLILKHVGIIYQQLYLVSTAIGFSPCALGVGNSNLFSRATSVPLDKGVCVGEFIIGG